MTYPPQPNPYGPPAGQQPPKSRPPLWVWVAAVFGALLVVGVIGSAVGGKGDSASKAASTTSTGRNVVASATSSVAAVPVPVAPAAPAASTTPQLAPTPQPAATRAPMPYVVCMNLQDAQDTIQEAGVFFSRSKDATGKGRMQVMDRNWIVVAQSPAPGTMIGEGEAVLSVVKIGEPSPCG